MSEKKGFFGNLFGSKKKSGCCGMEIVEEPESCSCGGACEPKPAAGEKAEINSDITTLRILGTGCKKCHTLEENVKIAVNEMGGGFNVIKVTDINEIASYGAINTPALMMGNKVVSMGKVLKPDEVKKILEKNLL